MGRRDRERIQRIREGLEIPFALANRVPCAGCGRRIPNAALRDGHGLLRWCGTLTLGQGLERDVYCPSCSPFSAKHGACEGCGRPAEMVSRCDEHDHFHLACSDCFAQAQGLAVEEDDSHA